MSFESREDVDSFVNEDKATMVSYILQSLVFLLSCYLWSVASLHT